MIASVLINGASGFALLLAALFCAGDLSAAIDSPTGQPFLAIFAQAVGSNGGATGMVCDHCCRRPVALLTCGANRQSSSSSPSCLPPWDISRRLRVCFGRLPGREVSAKDFLSLFQSYSNLDPSPRRISDFTGLFNDVLLLTHRMQVSPSIDTSPRSAAPILFRWSLSS